MVQKMAWNWRQTLIWTNDGLVYWWHICVSPPQWMNHDDVIKWKHFPRYCPFVRGIHRSLVNSPHKGQWRGALMFSLTCTRVNGWVNNGEAGDLRRKRARYDVTLMCWPAKVNILIPEDTSFQWVNSLRPSDIIWRQSGSRLVQLMVWCLTTPSHYQNQHWLIIKGVVWQLPESNFIRIAREFHL